MSLCLLVGETAAPHSVYLDYYWDSASVTQILPIALIPIWQCVKFTLGFSPPSSLYLSIASHNEFKLRSPSRYPFPLTPKMKMSSCFNCFWP